MELFALLAVHGQSNRSTPESRTDARHYAESFPGLWNLQAHYDAMTLSDYTVTTTEH